MTRRLTLALVILAVVAAPGFGMASNARATAEMVTVTVKVVDQSGDPISNAKLTASWNDGSATTTTRSNGQALVDVPKGANVLFRIDHGTYVRNDPYRLRNADAEAVTIDVAPKSSATITVTGPNGPIPGAQVAVIQNREPVAQGRTDNQGQFSTDVIEAGEYSVTLFKPGYYRTSEAVRIRGKTGTELSMEQGTVTLTFRVLDQNFDPAKPISEATISGSAIGSVKTQPNGLQQVSIPVNSKVEVAVEKEGYRTVKKTISVKESDKEVVIPTRKKLKISFDLVMERVVVGEKVRLAVTDQYGNPVANSDVFLDGNQVGTTDRNGVVIVSIDSPGEHTLHAEADSLSTDKHTLTGVKPASAVTTEAPQSNSAAASAPATAATERQAPQEASLGGVMAVPGTSQRIHLMSIGVGLAIGIVVVIALLGYVGARSRMGE